MPAQILSKPANLSAAEFELIKDHPQAGVDIIAGIDFPWPVASTVPQHHERLDGAGTRSASRATRSVSVPCLDGGRRPRGNNPPRPYRRAANVADALAEIERQSGTQFDPEVAAACLRLYSGMKRRRFDGDPGYWFPTAAAVAF